MQTCLRPSSTLSIPAQNKNSGVLTTNHKYIYIYKQCLHFPYLSTYYIKMVVNSFPKFPQSMEPIILIIFTKITIFI